MNLSSYKKVTIKHFKGLWARGDYDVCPQDHSLNCKDVWLNEPNEVSSRYGCAPSLASLNHNVVNMFLGTTSSRVALITLDSDGNFYLDDDTTPWFTVTGCTDFVALNIFNKVVINPFISTYPGSPLMIWDGTNDVRQLAGYAPTAGSAMIAADGAAGNVDLGTHKIAVCYETNTGFITPPGPKITGTFTPTSYAAPGGKQINLSNIPTGPDGTSKRILIMTKGDEEQYFFVPNGEIDDNTTTTATINCFDADLVIDASYLFDLLEEVPGGIGDGGLNKYHGRLLSWGGEGDLIRVSLPGDIESFNNVDGWIQIPSENDGNTVRGCFSLRDVLYFTKSVGILSTQDLSGDVPSSWPVIYIDGSVGSFNSGISTITSSQPGLPIDDVILLVDYQGIHVFNGVVIQPALTWKIEDLWKAIDGSKFQQITVVTDPFDRMIYVLIPDGKPYNLIVGDFTEGLSAKDIKWTHWDLPFVARSIGIINFQDDDSFGYYVRLGSLDKTQIFKMLPEAVADYDGANWFTIPAAYSTSTLQCEEGSLNIARGIRIHGSGTNPVLPILSTINSTEDFFLPVIDLEDTPAREYFRECNVMSEEFIITLQALQDYTPEPPGNVYIPGDPRHPLGLFKINRIDLFYGTKAKSRPA